MVANGVLVVASGSGEPDRRTHWRADEPMVPYLAFFAAGDFEIASGHAATACPGYVAVSEQLPPAPAATRPMELMPTRPATIVALARDACSGRYPFAATGGAGDQPEPGLRAGEPDPADVPRARRGRARR